MICYDQQQSGTAWHWERTLTPSCRIIIFFWKQWSLSHLTLISLFLMSQQYCHLLLCTCVEHLISPWRKLTDCRPFTVCEIQGTLHFSFLQKLQFSLSVKGKSKAEGAMRPWYVSALEWQFTSHIFSSDVVKEKLNVLPIIQATFFTQLHLQKYPMSLFYRELLSV